MFRRIRSLAAVEIQQNLLHREFWLTVIFNRVLPIVIPLLVWRAIFEGAGGREIQGWTADSMTTYYVLALLLTMLGTVEFHRTLGQMVHMGSLDQWLLRPFSAAEMATGFIVGRLVILCIPCFAALGILWIAAPDLFVSLSVHSLWNALLLLPLGLSIFAVLSVLVGTVAFWTMHTDSTFTLIMLILEFFGGAFLPLSLLPHSLRVVARFSPLRFGIADPIRAIIDPTAPITPVLLGQAAWLLILLLLTRACWHRGIRRYDAAGG